MKATKWHLILGLACIPFGIYGLKIGADFFGGAILWLSGANLTHWHRDLRDKYSESEEN